MPLPLILLPLLTVCCHPVLLGHASGSNNPVQAETTGYLAVSPDKFLSSLITARELVLDAYSMLPPSFSSRNSHGGLSGSDDAFSDCKDVLDLSADVLNWSISAVQNPNEYLTGTGDLSSDLRAWLSGALALHDTCLEACKAGYSNGKNITFPVQSNVSRSSSLINDLLSKIHSSTSSRSGLVSLKQNHRSRTQFSLEDEWVSAGNFLGRIPDAVVAQDGSGNYSSIAEAAEAAPSHSMRRHLIFVKEGVYREQVEIKKNKQNIMMVGQGMDSTVISWDRSVRSPSITTFNTATFSVKGKGFIACNMTFENTAGPARNQAVALLSVSDLSAFFRCGFRGYQDTLYPHSFRQFYRECWISGTIDFIFGRASAVFQDCEILARKGLPDQRTNTITANSRDNASSSSGFSFQSCNISADSSLVPYVNTTSTYLGRPWRNLSTTVFMQSYISEIIHPRGWIPWNSSNFFLDTLYYAEYGNYGPGAMTTGRVNWTGYHLIGSAEAEMFTVRQLIQGDLWLPSIGIAYKSGLWH